MTSGVRHELDHGLSTAQCRETAATGGSGGTGGSADELTELTELAELAELKNHGDLTVDEYERAKAKVLTAV